MKYEKLFMKFSSMTPKKVRGCLCTSLSLKVKETTIFGQSSLCVKQLL